MPVFESRPVAFESIPPPWTPGIHRNGSTCRGLLCADLGYREQPVATLLAAGMWLAVGVSGWQPF